MEGGDSGNRHNGHPPPTSSTPNYPSFYSPAPRESFDRPSYRPPTTAMATATLISPGTPYHSSQHSHSPFSAGYPSIASSATSVSAAMISPVDSSRRSDDGETPHRTSLPSIRDIIGESSSPGTNNLPSPFSAHPAQPPPPRSYAESMPTREKAASPRSLDNRVPSYSRSEPLPPFSNPSQPAVQRPGPPPLSIFSGSHPSAKLSGPEPTDPRQHAPPPPEPSHLNGQYSHHAAPPPPPPSSHPHAPPPMQAHQHYNNGHTPLPPGQLPLTGFPISPRHPAAHTTSPYNAQRPPMGPGQEDAMKYHQHQHPNRHFEAWNYTECLAKIASSAHLIFNFAENYGKIAQEEQHGPLLPSRMPNEGEMAEILQNCDNIAHMVESIRATALRMSAASSDRMRDGPRPSRFGDDDDVSMYDGGMKQSYNVMEGKKRRGRAAPPGRCHSCNRMDTPEWRRGPDGARTLCNACGLHYAKLERKKQMENRQAKPKNEERL